MRRRQSLALALILGACKPSPAPSTTAGTVASPSAASPAADPAPPPGGDPGGGPPPVSLRFTNVTEAAGVAFVHRSGARGDRIYLEPHSGGCAVLHADGDEWPDLYLVNGGPLPPDPAARRPNRLFRNRGDGTFFDATSETGAPGTGYGFGAYPADYDGDGDDDLFVTQYGPDALYRNRGDGTMEEVAGPAGVAGRGWSTGAAWLDADLDGDLDLYVVHYVTYDVRRPKSCWRQGHPYHCGPYDFPGEADQLFMNGGGGVFEAREVRQPVGKGLGALAWDFDVDGRPDLYVANDETPNALLRGAPGGIFEEVGLLWGVSANGSGAVQAGMGLDAGDLDGDGLPDLIVTNFHGEWNNDYRHLAPDLFRDHGERSGFGPPGAPYVGFGAVLFDGDLDGDLDAFVANGHVWDNVAKIDEGVSYPQTNLVLQNDGAGRFADVSDRAGPALQAAEVSRGVCLLDYDGDGDEDVAYVNIDAPATLLRNDSPPAGAPWIGVRPIPPEGARVEVRAAPGGPTRVRQSWRVRGYLSASEAVVRVGLGPGAVSADVRVVWPGGRVTERKALAAGRVHRLSDRRLSP